MPLHRARAGRLLVAVAGILIAAGARAEEVRIDSLLVIEPVGRGGRSPVVTDAVEHARVTGTFRTPREGESVRDARGRVRTWRRIRAGEDGELRDPALRGGWALATVEAERERVMLLHAIGHRHVLVNGTPRGGDLYGLGLMRLPVLVTAGRNELLFRAGRGRLRARLSEPPAPVFLERIDRVLPDVLRGEGGAVVLGLPVTNATVDVAGGYRIRSQPEGGVPSLDAVPALPRLTTRRVTASVRVSSVGYAADALSVLVELLAPDGRVVSSDTLDLPVRDPREPHRRTFVSDTDGSVQSFAVTPATSPEAASLVLTLHGAGVEAIGQARAYAPKDWATIVAPTNRRPFGFDWEDWGRLDALEVLEITQELYRPDPARIYLTGHSMGGHGTWQLGAHYPDRFAAIAPSAGWRDFWSYGGAATLESEDPVSSLLRRATNASRTLLMLRNYAGLGVYVLHGDHDRNVPVSQARFLRERLGTFHPNFAYYERPGAGHWWGNACVDWPPLFAFLRRNSRPADHERTRVEFVTVNPGLSSRRGYLSIEAQERWLQPSRAKAVLDPEEREVRVTCDNVAALRLFLGVFREEHDGRPAALAGERPVRISVNGGEPIPVDAGRAGSGVLLARGDDGSFGVVERAATGSKGPRRAGPFKEAFRHRMLFVYGTAGSPAERRASFERARFDAETFQYRGNGSVDLVPDTRFDFSRQPDRGVVLYGNADTNAAFGPLLAGSPITVRRGEIRVGERAIAGDDLACLLVRPRPGSEVASVGVVGGTGPAGLRLTESLPYFVSGVGYPDWIVIGPEALESGIEGVRAAGFFDGGWRLSPADTAWRDAGGSEE